MPRRPVGLAALHGSTPDVSVVGYSLGGGMGWYARKHGLAANSVSAIELVTADGQLRRVDADTEPELFWALRGGGGNFGVVTALEFELYPVSSVYAACCFPVEPRERGAARVARVAPGRPDEVTSLGRSAVPAFRTFRIICGASRSSSSRPRLWAREEDGRALMKPLRDLGPAMDTFEMRPRPDSRCCTWTRRSRCRTRAHTYSPTSCRGAAVDDFLAVTGPGSGSPLVSVGSCATSAARSGGAARGTVPSTGSRARSSTSASALLRTRTRRRRRGRASRA